MNFEDGMYLAIAIMAGGSVLLGIVVAMGARLSGDHRGRGREHARG